MAGRRAKKAVQRDWSSLPPELLNLIAKNISEISDFVRFRAVCTTWRFSISTMDFPPQFPWILEKRDYPYKKRMLFYSTTSSKMYTIHAPKYLDKRLFGSSQGYILSGLYSSRHTCLISLLNPLNNHKIPLPALNFGDDLHWIGSQIYQIGNYMVYFGYRSRKGSKIAFCCLGQDKWRVLKLDYDNIEWFLFNSMLLGVMETGVTKVIDMATGTVAYVIPPIDDYDLEVNQCLVDASGDILRVSRHHDYEDWFEVHQLDLIGSGSPCWVKVNSIGNQALFIDKYGGFALGASDISGVKANCIYYINYYLVKKIDIQTGDEEVLHCPFKELDHWFLPNLEPWFKNSLLTRRSMSRFLASWNGITKKNKKNGKKMREVERNGKREMSSKRERPDEISKGKE
ncbi:hypothetical protein LUZ63_009513 [Rhynchospora breviuscula]|uniref:F-box domain-containing protein n=1 Tax=Rhynchospora breviuscula TaxID=2022672 RepID=A0A9Q0CFB6_9POAL|nr:hypothetical protein LUZ63_009513 [Rhynchospora breviuscula]